MKVRCERDIMTEQRKIQIIFWTTIILFVGVMIWQSNPEWVRNSNHTFTDKEEIYLLNKNIPTSEEVRYLTDNPNR